MTVLRVISAESDSLKDANEDAVGAGSFLAWAMDGASALNPHAHPASEYVVKLHEGATCSAEVQRDVREHLRRIWSHASFQVPDPRARPSAGLVLAGVHGDMVQLLTLGDLTILVEKTDGAVDELHDSRLGPLDSLVVDRIRHIVSGGASFREARNQVNEQLIDHRMLMNQATGYWILDPTTDISMHATVWEYPVEHVRAIALLSDGFERVRDMGIVASWPGLFEHVRRHGSCTDVILELREREHADPDVRQYPRLSVHDDASIIVVAPVRP